MEHDGQDRHHVSSFLLKLFVKCEGSSGAAVIFDQGEKRAVWQFRRSHSHHHLSEGGLDFFHIQVETLDGVTFLFEDLL